MIETVPEVSPEPAPSTEGSRQDAGNRAIRARLGQLIEDSGEGYASISRLIGRNPAYIQQFIKRGVPRRLSETDRRLLAGHFGVPESLLGGPAGDGAMPAGGSAIVAIPCIGNPGGDPGPDLLVDRRLVERLTGGRGDLAALAIDGDSMAPTLASGDRILVDRADSSAARDGIYVIGSDDRLLVKRLSVHPVTRRIAILADNPAYPDFPDCDPAAVALVGRVVWVARAL